MVTGLWTQLLGQLGSAVAVLEWIRTRLKYRPKGKWENLTSQKPCQFTCQHVNSLSSFLTSSLVLPRHDPGPSYGGERSVWVKGFCLDTTLDMKKHFHAQ